MRGFPPGDFAGNSGFNSDRFGGGSANSRNPIRLIDGVLHITGTDLSDLIEISDIRNSLIRASITTGITRTEKEFNSFDVSYINVQSFGGNDTIESFAVFDSYIHGGTGHDSIRSGNGDDLIYGAAGNDEIIASGGRDNIFGNGGHDIIEGNKGNDLIVGGGGNDSIWAGAGSDYVRGSTGNDLVYLGGGNDVALGESGRDEIYGEIGNDIIEGQGGVDMIDGGAGNDKLFGGGGNDQILGGGGKDALSGGAGTNTLEGEGGADRFLKQSGDSVVDRTFDDATIHFVKGKRITVAADAKTDVTFNGGTFRDFEVFQMDVALEALQNEAGNTNLLKTSTGRDLTFVRQTHSFQGDPRIDAWNDGNFIYFANGSFNSTRHLHQVLFHEIGHNWDELSENGSAQEFRSISRWTSTEPENLRPYAVSLDRAWWYKSGVDFARRYGWTNPFEDFATSFSAYFMDILREEYIGVSVRNDGKVGYEAAPRKMGYMQRFASRV